MHSLLAATSGDVTKAGKAIALLVVLFAAVASDPQLALAAAATYALAYTFELGLSLVLYFGTTS